MTELNWYDPPARSQEIRCGVASATQTLPAEARFCLSCGTRVEGPAPEASADPLLEVLENVIGFQYRIERLLGRGGMGAAYLAHELALDRDVAIKVLPPEHASTPQLRERFKREARTAARLSHPHIVPLYTFGEVSGLVYSSWDVWDRLPRTMRQFRMFKGLLVTYMIAVYAPLQVMTLWERRLPALRQLLLVAALTGLSLLFVLRRSAVEDMRARSGGAEAGVLLNTPTWRVSIWRRAPAASLLAGTMMARTSAQSASNPTVTRLVASIDDDRSTQA